MTLLPDTLKSLALGGASPRLDARRLSSLQMQEIAGAVAQGGGRLLVRNAQAMTPDQATTLVGIAGRAVEFDVV